MSFVRASISRPSVSQAHRLQEHAVFESAVAIAAGKQKLHEKHTVPDPDPDSEEERQAGSTESQKDIETDESDYDAFPYFDVSTNEAVSRLMSEATPSQSPAASTSVPADHFDASVKLAKFQPFHESVAALRALLEARADPNIIPGPTELSPLRNVIWSARTKDVVEMRALLLAHGAKQSLDDKKRWATRRGADLNEPAWLKNFHKDDREG